jgi:hypothetical protein
VLAYQPNWPKVQAKAVAARREAAEAFAKTMQPIIRQLQAEGLKTPQAIAAALDACGMQTRTGKSWHSATVIRLLARMRSTRSQT